MQLTEKEIVLAEELLNRYEKKTASWPRNRWVCVSIAIAGIFVGSYWFIESLTAINSESSYEVTEIIKSGQEPTSEEAHLWAVGTMLKAAKILELRQKMLFFASQIPSLTSLSLSLLPSKICQKTKREFLS